MIPEKLEMFGDKAHIEEYDMYWIVYAGKSLSKEERTLLKSSGWRLQRHTRSNEEIWILNKFGTVCTLASQPASKVGPP